MFHIKELLESDLDTKSNINKAIMDNGYFHPCNFKMTVPTFVLEEFKCVFRVKLTT